MEKQTDLIEFVHNQCINTRSREVYLHGYINDEEEMGVDNRMGVMLMKNMHMLDNLSDKPICIHMHTIGGYVSDGMSIFNTIQFSRSFVTVVAYSEAQSMSSIILQAADKRVMMPDTVFMLHRGSDHMDGTHLACASYMEFAKRWQKRLTKIYIKGCMKGAFFKDKTEKYVTDYINKKMDSKGDWWLDAEEAIHYGFADCIVENLQELKTPYEK